jgi:gliding motility-associated-like protein
LQAYYRFDNNNSTVLPDLTGNGYNGNLGNIPATAWHYSSAPIGDTSANIYPATWAAQALSLNYAPGDVFNVSNLTANPDGAHIYRVASLPNVTTGLSSPLSDYYGVFLTGTSGFYDISEDFSAYTSSCSGNCLKLASRNDNAVLSWTTINPVVNNCVLTKTNESSVGSPYRAEYILSVSTTSLSVTSTNVSCNGGTDGKATANASGGTAPYTYTWSPLSDNTPSLNAGAGNYTVSVTDAAGCSQSLPVTISQPAPITVTTGSTSVCQGQPATVSAQAAGGTAPYTYVWNGLSVGQSYTAVPTANSIYSVTVTDASGCQSPFAVAFVTVLPPLQVSVGDATSCAGISTSLSAHATGGYGNYIYNWMPGNLTGNPISVSPQNTIVYTVTVSDGCSINNASDTGIISITSTIPTLTLPSASTGCPPVCINFNVPYTGSDITNWSWNFGDNTTASAQNPQHCYKSPGNFNVSLSYSTSLGCSKTITGNDLVTVFNAPTANFSATSFDLDVITPSIVFINQSQSATAYQWNFGDSQYSTDQNPSHQYPSTVENYSVSLVASNAQGCTDTVTHVVYVRDAFAFYAPNCFTPNADNLNEQFLPVGAGWNNASFNIQVFDRWGNLIFKSDNADKGWNGTCNGTGGSMVQEGVYVWKVELLDNKNQSHNYSGTITLLK